MSRLSPMRAVSVLALLWGCSSTPTPPPEVPVAAPTPPPVQQAVAPIDLSPVPAPESLGAVVRIASPRGFAERLGERFGLGTTLTEQLQSALPGLLEDDEGLAAVVDLGAPADVLVGFDARHQTTIAVAGGALPMDRLETRLSDGHVLRPATGAVRRVERTGRGSDRRSSVRCDVAHAAPGPLTARIVCAEDPAALDLFVPYAARTLPTRPLSADDGDLVVEPSPDAVRRELDDDLREMTSDAIESLRNEIRGNGPRSDAARSVVNDLQSSLNALLTDLTDARLSLRLGEAATGSDLTATVGVRANPTGPLTAPVLASVLGAHPPVDRLASLPPGGLLYTAWSVDLQPLRAFVNRLSPAVTALLLGEANTPGGEGDALQTALAALLAQDHLDAANAHGFDAQGHDWWIANFQPTTPPAQFLANARAALAALQRPAITRAVRARHQLDLTRMRVVTGPTVPAGALLVQIPSTVRVPSTTAPRPATPAPRPAPGARPAAPEVTELLLVADGARLWGVLGRDARGLLRTATAAHPAPLQVDPEDAVGLVALVPAALPSAFHSDPSLASTLQRAMASAADHGSTPAVLRWTVAEQGGGVSVRTRLRVAPTLLRALGEVVGGLLRGF